MCNEFYIVALPVAILIYGLKFQIIRLASYHWQFSSYYNDNVTRYDRRQFIRLPTDPKRPLVRVSY